ncbi:hypothetical protein Q9L42_019695 [Methylomarinum sp. Ch1-1]|uniref:Uncharacterized protein n=1 Tax=Methylomarinum roseum TaxID=3067653 RepID=A0AAU7NUB0_9GAMM|nr:hypothetical protein [Methylomarinum sp. Ch1-1]MDP4519384.1 hypothetical protein [Methylomarinum sp. Ch1-1]
MAEITPITPTHPPIRPHRIERDDKRRQDEQQQPRRDDDSGEQGGDEPLQHIDERV